MAKSLKTETSFESYTAPDFTLASSAGGHVSLTDLKGQWAVLFFYPTDNTPTCTQEDRRSCPAHRTSARTPGFKSG